ncbi:MAG: NAD(P)H-dependent oxidoreductase subunit E [Caulobacteraceae bacterium]
MNRRGLGNMEKDVLDIAARYGGRTGNTLAILQDIQKKYNYIPREALILLSAQLKVPLSKLYSIATFYKALSLQPKGKNIIKICDGTACHIRSSLVLIEEMEKLLHIKPGETSNDGEFSLETVNCLGSCAIAPVMVINGTYYGKVTPSKLRSMIERYGGTSNE